MSQYRDYWESYYQSDQAPETPSLFAQYVAANYLKDSPTQPRLVELGCGNGRDSSFFASLGMKVLALDQCQSEIEKLSQANPQPDNLEFRTADFTQLPDGDSFDIIYSRFTLHSVDEEGQDSTLRWAERNLRDNGVLCIETRGKQNELYQLGDPVDNDPDAYIYEGHYRRFVGLDPFVKKIGSIGLVIAEASESTGYAPFNGTDQYFIRVFANKTA